MLEHGIYKCNKFRESVHTWISIIYKFKKSLKEKGIRYFLEKC